MAQSSATTSGGQQNGFSQQFGSQSAYDVRIQMVMLYNPTLEPASKKPSEEQIQDAKLLYYYPRSSPIEEKRNHVGLAEGSFEFFSGFQTFETEQLGSKKQPQQNNKQVISLDRYIHVQEEVEKDLWLYIVLAKSENSNETLSTRLNGENEYYSSETGTYEQSKVTEAHALLFLKHFYDTFTMFFGEMKPISPEPFAAILDEFIVRYKKLNGDETSGAVNVLRYQFGGFQYAPIEKTIFLTLQSLVNILSTIDSNVKHFSIFFAGYFIYSSLDHNAAFEIYEYLYGTESPCSYSDRKIAQKLRHRSEEFIIGDETTEESNQKGCFYGEFFNALKVGVVANSTSLNEEKWSKQVRLQKLFIQQAGKKNEYKMNVYYERQLAIVMLYPPSARVTLGKLAEMNTCISRNCEKLTWKVEKSINDSVKKEEVYKYVYFNQMNIATKIAQPLVLAACLAQEIDVIQEVYSNLASQTANHSAQQVVVKASSLWVYGYKNLSRIVILLLPATISLNKLHEEVDKMFKNYFPLLYM